jgi:hypothetical protein
MKESNAIPAYQKHSRKGSDKAIIKGGTQRSSNLMTPNTEPSK